MTRRGTIILIDFLLMAFAFIGGCAIAFLAGAHFLYGGALVILLDLYGLYLFNKPGKL